MAFDENANIILAGMDTTHPVMAETPGDAAQQAAQIQNTQADTSLRNTEISGMQAQQALQRQQLQDAQASARAFQQVLKSGLPNQGASASNPGTPITTGGGPDGNSAPSIIPPTSTPAIVNPNNPQPQPGISEYAAGLMQKNGWTVDTKHDWYLDQDGEPVPHSGDGAPAYSPNGRKNMVSNESLAQLADAQEAAGVSPQVVVANYLAGQDKGRELDKGFVDQYKAMKDADEAAQRAAASKQEAFTRVQETNANLAYQDTINAKNGIPLQQSAAQTVAIAPRYWAGKLAQAGLSLPQGVDPTSAQGVGMLHDMVLDPKNAQAVNQVWTATAATSPQAVEQQKIAATGIHILPGAFNPNTGTTDQSTAFKVGPDGKVVRLIGGSTPTASTPNGTTPTKTPLQAMIEGVGTYQIPESQVPAKMRQFVQQGVAQQFPDYDASQFNAKNKALTDYTSGQDHKTVVAIQTAYNHLDQLKTAVSALQSGNTPLFNQMSQAYEKATGSPLPTDVAAIKLVALDEVSKALTGASGGEGDRTAAQNIVNQAGSPSQVSGAIDKLSELMRGKVGPLQDAATAAGLTEKQKQSIFGNLYQVPGPSGRVGGASAAPAATAAPQVKIPTKAGDIVTDSKGKSYAYKGTGDVHDINNYLPLSK